MLIHRIAVKNLLSFGPNGIDLPLQHLNVLIGPNGSGKSNLIEAIGLLKSAPKLLASPVKDGGGIADWLWKGGETPTATLEVNVDNPDGQMRLSHSMSFTETTRRFDLVDERIENETAYPGQSEPHFYYRFQHNHPVLNVKGEGRPRQLKREDVDPEQSILSQRKDPDQYPEITYLGQQYERIRIYREWSFGRYTAPRQPQKADERNDYLEDDFRNLGLVLNRLRQRPMIMDRLLETLSHLYAGIDDVDVSIEGGSVQVFFREGRFTIPATRLSDGTLRFLCLLVLLYHPTPPPLVCVEEPELGLHPDVMPGLAELLREASIRTQLIVTTHSDVLVDALTDSPEDVIVCEKHEGQTTMERLDSATLKTWLEEYGLGQLWRSGEIGGNRW